MQDEGLAVVAGQEEVDQGADDDPYIVVDKTGPGAEEDDPGQKGDPAGDNRDHDLDDLNQDKDDGAEDLFASQIGAHLGLAGKNPQLVPVDAEANDHDG